MSRIVLLLIVLAAAVPAACRDAEPPASAPDRAARGAVSFYTVGDHPRSIAAGDLDGDGHLDLAVANAGVGTVTVLLGDGTGRLHGSLSFDAGREPSDVDAVDIDRDGDIDLVVANHETPGITVLLNDGRARFTPAPGSPFDTGARPHVHGLAIADVDGDGWVDVAVDSADTNEVRILEGGPGGPSAPIAVPVGTMPYYRLGVGDVDRDGRPEILVPGHTDRTVRAVEHEGGRMRAAAWTIRLGGKPWMVRAGDVDGDGDDDIVVVESDAVSLWLGSPGGHSQAPGSQIPVPGATEVALGDLDGDRAADVAIGPWDGDEVTVVLSGGTGSSRIRLCERPIGLAIADLNGDGRGELVAACATSNRIAVTTVAPAP